MTKLPSVRKWSLSVKFIALSLFLLVTAALSLIPEETANMLAAAAFISLVVGVVVHYVEVILHSLNTD